MDGVSVLQKLGRGTVEGYLFSEDQYRQVFNTSGQTEGRATRNGLYALRGTYQPAGPVTVGLLVDHFQSSGVNQQAGIVSTNNAEADVTFQAATNLLLKAEYGRSDDRSRNDLYYGLIKYGFTSHDSATVYTYKIGRNPDVGQDSGYPNNSRGTRYFLEHDFDAHTSLIVYHEVDRALWAGAEQLGPSHPSLHVLKAGAEGQGAADAWRIGGPKWLGEEGVSSASAV